MTRIRYVLVGTGNRGTTMWGQGLLAGWSDYVELVGICDLNLMRAERARTMIGSGAPLFDDVDRMLAELKPDLAIVCTPDATHDDIIVKALEAGANVISEKPMATTKAKVERIRDAEARTGKRVDVSFNYRFSPTAARIKELIEEGAIGTVTSVDFHWYLDNQHGADYFRRWHAFTEHSGSLFVHKATHHFDLLNWFLDSDPEEVKGFGQLLHYGRQGPFRGPRCRTCEYAEVCDYHMDLGADPFLDTLYEEPSAVDGYFRDACVFREEIDVPDTMTASIRYRSGVQVSYSLNTYMPIEGHHIAFNGHKGRIEMRQYEKQPWSEPPADEILLVKSFGGGVERIWVPHEPGGHYGGDNRMRDMIFKPGSNDRLRQRAGSRAGAMSVLVGVAALQSSRAGGSVAIDPLPPEFVR
ncbi:Gfo/Idh/MocA family protein [Aureimonas leprariae]|uniref:Gfo/Idh/MocA family oxidoreductase n=1 Tax=Plantimonas leprariae TaxID=2615207 RepID=A0A7V7PNR9_9HYPH|nr:Gfo/Idh/MocA family oxidoreductase [Aureimonas leprariae]KAB0679308.1 Gfo/Idh/MocA family oxidoreductase [Aureimonas leprariae]